MLKSHPDVHMVWYGNSISRTRYSNNLYYKGLCGEATHYAVYMSEHSQVISNIVSLYWIEYCVVTEKGLWSSCNPRTLEAEAAELWDTAQPGQLSEFKATLDCIARHCLKNVLKQHGKKLWMCDDVPWDAFTIWQQFQSELNVNQAHKDELGK